MTLCYRLGSGPQTLVLATDGGVPAVVYWGATLPDDDLQAVATAAVSDITGGMVDVQPALSLCPEAGRGFPGQPGLVLADADGTPLLPSFTFDAADETQGQLCLTSRAEGLRLIHKITAEPSGVFALKTVLEADQPIRLHWLAAPVLPAPAGREMIDFSGKWTQEFQPNRVPWTPGARLREARNGRSGHEHFPALVLPEDGATNTDGCAFALTYGWSGGHRMVAEELQDGRRQIQFGHAWGAELHPDTRFETAPLYVAFSETGLNGIGTAFQHHLRDHLVPWPDARRARPVHYNCWEAVYFDHDMSKLSELATQAADLGAERFVLDDGWFGRRDDDTSSLGDWDIDPRKWPDGLTPLIDHVHKLGMGFGLWVEPEMVNPNSDLYRAHPDWVLGPADQVTGRNQLVLDMARPDVQDYLLGWLDTLLAGNAIEYLKWDHNRLLPLVDAAQTRGVYDLLDRLRATHPEVEIESCASGGGRIDYGILARTHRVWLSDSNDALERLRMQHEAALFLPSCVTGSHVGPRHCHTSGRVLPMAFRAWVAAQRHLGFEMDLQELTGDEARVLAEITTWWKANRDWMLAGDILRLTPNDPSVTAELQIAADGHRFVVFAGQTEVSAHSLPQPLRLAGLDPQARYRVALKNPEDAPPHSRGPNALKSGPLVLSGQYLMRHGMTLPVAWPATMWVIEGQRLSPEEVSR